MTVKELERVRQWAETKVAGGAEPPWASHLYMRLSETIDALIAGMAATAQQAEPKVEHLKVVAPMKATEAA
jgi:hypothetical protein